MKLILEISKNPEIDFTENLSGRKMLKFPNSETVNYKHMEMKIAKMYNSSLKRKFQDFTVTHILREINFGESRRSKSTVFAILRQLNIVKN